MWNGVESRREVTAEAADGPGQCAFGRVKKGKYKEKESLFVSHNFSCAISG